MAEPDPRRQAPAAARNRDPILAVLRQVLPETGAALEIGSGSGEHVVHFARALPGWRWTPSDPDPDACASIAAWTASEGLTNIAPPLALDVLADWGVNEASLDAVLSLNMIHIASWECTPALIAGAARALRPGGLFFLYGPFMRGGAHTAPSNEQFDGWLKAKDERFGVRAMEDVARIAAEHGAELRETVEMPANNFSLVFRAS